MTILVASVLIFFVAIASLSSADAVIPPPQLFFDACHSGDLATIKDLVSERPHLVHATSREGDHCIHIASLDGRLDIMTVLLENGANANIRTLPQNRMRACPMHWAALFGRYDEVELLLKYNAHVNIDFDVEMNDGEIKQMTPLDVVEMMMDEIWNEKEEGQSSMVLLGKVIKKVSDEGEGRDRYVKTRDVLRNVGAMRFSELSMMTEEL